MRTQRGDGLHASLPGHSLSLRQETRPGESALPLGLGYVTALGMGCRGRAFGHYTRSCGQPHNISITVKFFFYFISFNRWALDKMHEENSNEKTSRKIISILLLIPSHCKCPSALVFGHFLMSLFLAKKCFVPAPW